MIEHADWYEVVAPIGVGGPTGEFKAKLISDIDTGTIDIEITFRARDNRDFDNHEMALRIRAQVVNEIFFSHLIAKALTTFALCIACDVIMHTVPIVAEIYRDSRRANPEAKFKDRTKDVLGRLKEQRVYGQAAEVAKRSLVPCAKDAVVDAVFGA